MFFGMCRKKFWGLEEFVFLGLAQKGAPKESRATARLSFLFIPLLRLSRKAFIYLMFPGKPDAGGQAAF